MMKTRRTRWLWRVLALALALTAAQRPGLVLAAPKPTSLAQTPPTHVVQPGENLFRIALRYGTTIDALVAANGLADARRVYVGQRLAIPSAADVSIDGAASAGSGVEDMIASGGQMHTVRAGETLIGIARRYGTSVDALMRANSLASTVIHSGQRLAVDVLPSSAEIYRVKPGDTLSSIAVRFGVSVAELARWNGIVNTAAIYPGQVLRLGPRTSSLMAADMPGGTGARRIVIDISDQHLYAFEGEMLVYSFVASTGRPGAGTKTGSFRVQSKLPRAYGSAWNIWMPYWLGIYWAGSLENGIHALPETPGGQTLWASSLGHPISFGCIVLETSDARLLYNWADVGISVTVRH